MSRLQKKYNKEAVPAMKSKFGYKNDMAVPKIVKVTVNVGVGKMVKEEKRMENIARNLTMIAGQKAVPAKAKKSIAGFKLREGTVVGYMATLRGRRMYDFLDRMISVALPRTRDFRGIDPKSFDSRGNLTFGFKEHIVFPEREEGELKDVFGFEVTIATSARNKEEGVELLRLMGFPIKKVS